jgi:hypothetical protein
MFMAESPDRRLIEPAANLVNEKLPGELSRGIGKCEQGVIAAKPIRLAAR